MGSGTDVAIESAGVTLLKGDLMGIVRARRLSAATMANIRQNLFFAFFYNAIGIPVAAGVLYPLLGVLLSRSCRRHGALIGERRQQCMRLRLRRI
jgi:Cu+-exporting ATPase